MNDLEIIGQFGGSAYVLGRVVDAAKAMGLVTIEPWIQRRKNVVEAEAVVLRAEARRQERIIDESAKADIKMIRSGKAFLEIDGSISYIKDMPGSVCEEPTPDSSLGKIIRTARVSDDLDKAEKMLVLREIVRIAEEESERLGTTNLSDVQIDRGWLAHFKDGAECSADDDQMRLLWSRLLLAEAENPGTQSLRTISILNMLSPADAKTFAKLAPLIVSNSFFCVQDSILQTFNEGAPITNGFSESDFLDKANVTPNDLLHLQAIGLIIQSTFPSVMVPETTTLDGKRVWMFAFSNKLSLTACNPKSKSHLILPGNFLTQAGQQIVSLGDFDPDRYFIDTLANYLKNFNPDYIAITPIRKVGSTHEAVGASEFVYRADL